LNCHLFTHIVFDIGNYSIRSLGTPLLNAAVYDATKKIPNPDEQETSAKTVYDKWLSSFPMVNTTLPRYFLSLQLLIRLFEVSLFCLNNLVCGTTRLHFRISDMGSGSDYAPFIQQVGLPCLDIRYTYNSVRCYLISRCGISFIFLFFIFFIWKFSEFGF
jgi:hypothetical protein